jgi:1-acyl-sn-glycerol-3-phosphate acyltransferase
VNRIGTLYYISRAVFTILMNILFRVRVRGKENVPKPPFIIASNHASYLDPPLLGRACERYQVHFMAKRELFETSVFGAWVKGVGCIPVDRGKNTVGAIREAIKRLKKGQVIGVFPEGTRSVNGDIQEAKKGMGFLIAKAHVPVVPVYIEGTARAMPKGGRLKFSSHIGAFVGKPITSAEYLSEQGPGKQDYEAISSLVMRKIAELGSS